MEENLSKQADNKALDITYRNTRSSNRVLVIIPVSMFKRSVPFAKWVIWTIHKLASIGKGHVSWNVNWSLHKFSLSMVKETEQKVKAKKDYICYVMSEMSWILSSANSDASKKTADAAYYKF